MNLQKTIKLQLGRKCQALLFLDKCVLNFKTGICLFLSLHCYPNNIRSTICNFHDLPEKVKKNDWVKEPKTNYNSTDAVSAMAINFYRSFKFFDFFSLAIKCYNENYILGLVNVLKPITRGTFWYASVGVTQNKLIVRYARI